MADEPVELSEEVRDLLHERWHELGDDHLTPRQREQRRLAGQMRTVIDRLVATSAPEEALRFAADSLERLAAEFDQYPQGNTYEGFAEAANAGGDQSAFFFKEQANLLPEGAENFQSKPPPQKHPE